MKPETPFLYHIFQVEYKTTYFSRATDMHAQKKKKLSANGTHAFWNLVAFSLRAPIQISLFIDNIFTIPCQKILDKY